MTGRKQYASETAENLWKITQTKDNFAQVLGFSALFKRTQAADSCSSFTSDLRICVRSLIPEGPKCANDEEKKRTGGRSLWQRSLRV